MTTKHQDRQSSSAAIIELDAPAQMLTDDETERLILKFMEGRPDKTATRTEIEAVLAWARGVRMHMALLELVLRGDMRIHLQDGTKDVSFSIPIETRMTG